MVFNLGFLLCESNGQIPPVLYSDNIITGGDWSIYSFNAKTGELNWKTEFIEHKPFPLWSTAKHLLHENKIYVNNAGFNIRCLNADTGELIWHNPTDAPNCTTTMTYYQDMLVFTSWGYGSIMVLDALTGEKIHREYSHNGSTFNTDVIYDQETDMFFTIDYLYAYGFKIHKPEE
ncbi:MAG: PQQ-binding-like beta-propeller repeat protein [Saprospiraceae bacterium]